MTDDNFKFIIPQARFSFILKIALVLSFFTLTAAQAESYRLYADSETATYEKSNRGIFLFLSFNKGINFFIFVLIFAKNNF
jgi:hypothetical protein